MTSDVISKKKLASLGNNVVQHFYTSSISNFIFYFTCGHPTELCGLTHDVYINMHILLSECTKLGFMIPNSL